MGIWGQGAIRAGCLFAAVCIAEWLAGWHWDFDNSTFGLWLLLGGIPTALWARADTLRLGFVAAEWIWTHVAAWAAFGTVIVAVMLRGTLIALPIACVTAAGVAVPAWSSINGTARRRPTAATGSQRRVPADVMGWVTVSGVGLFLPIPIVVLGVLASIEWSGCFFDCQQPNHCAALGLSTATAVLIADVAIWGVAAWHRFPRLLTGVAAIPVCGYAVAALFMG